MMLLGVALVRGVLVGLRVMWGVGRLSGFAWLGGLGGGGGFSWLGTWFSWLGRLGGLCGGFAWLLCRGCLSRLGGFAWLLCRGCLSRLSRLFLGLRAEKRTQSQKGPNDYDTHIKCKSTQFRANASP
jgi:hypothetical protein